MRRPGPIPDGRPGRLGPPPLAACGLLAVLLLLFAAALTTLVSYPGRFLELEGRHTLDDLWQGRTVTEAEQLYEELFSLQQEATGLWGALRYALFRAGSEEVLVGKNGWLYINEEFERVTDGDREIQAKLQAMTQVNAYLRAHGVQLVVALIPSKARLYPEALWGKGLPAFKARQYRAFLQDLQARGIYAPDLMPPLTAAKRQAQLFMRTDTHWSPAGAQAAADIVRDLIRRDCGSLSLPVAAFRQRELPAEPYEGDLMKYIATGPLARWFGIAGETLRRREVTAVNETAGPPETVLVGTSFSAVERWNFVGALKMALGTEVQNASIKGVGPMEPMRIYLESGALERHPPKLLIWELPERSLEIAYPMDFTLPPVDAAMQPPLHCRLDTAERSN